MLRLLKDLAKNCKNKTHRDCPHAEASSRAMDNRAGRSISTFVLRNLHKPGIMSRNIYRQAVF